MSNYNISSILRTGNAQFSSTSQIENSIKQQRMKGSQEQKQNLSGETPRPGRERRGGRRGGAGRPLQAPGSGLRGARRRRWPRGAAASASCYPRSRRSKGGVAAAAGSAAWDARLGPPPVRPWQCIIQPCFSSFRFCCGETYSKLDILLHVTPGGETGIWCGKLDCDLIKKIN